MSIAMLMASCSNDDLESVVSNGNEAQVSFTVALNSTPGTRAISDGFTVDELYYEVYDKAGNKIDAISGKKENAFKNLKETVYITLAKGQTYTFGFWAQKKDAYVANDLKRVELNYEGVGGNNEARDAFFAYTEPITVTGNFEHSVTLKRPFAQLNLAVSDLEAFQAAGGNLKQVEVTVSEVAGNFDVTTGKVSGAVSPTTFSLADVLYNGDADADKMLTLKNGIGLKDKDGNEILSFPWVSMNYLLVNDETTGAASSNVDVTFTIKTDKDDVVITSTGTPVQRNYRTNLIASLTNTGTFNIVIDPIYDGEINKEDEKEPVIYNVALESNGKTYQTIAEAMAAATANDVITLAAGQYDLANDGLRINKGITIQAAEGLAAADVVLDGMVIMDSGNLKNVTLTASKSVTNLMLGYFGGDCLAEGVIFNCPAQGVTNAFKEYSSLGDGKKHNVTFKNCVINANGQRPFQFDIVKATVEDCVIDNPYRYCVQLGQYSNSCDLTFKNNRVIKYGSTNQEFYTYVQIDDQDAQVGDNNKRNNVVTLEGNTHDGSVANKWQDFVIENTVSNVSINFADGVAFVNGAYEISNANGMFWFANEVNVAGKTFSGQTLKLAADIDLANQLWEPIGQTDQLGQFQGTFDGNDKTIKNLRIDKTSKNGTHMAAGLFGWVEWSSVCIKNLTIDGATVKAHHYAGAVVGYNSAPVENCTVKNANISCVYNTVLKDDGDKAGAIVGYNQGAGKIKDCSAENCQIDAVRDAGQLVGAAKTADVSGTATNVTVSHNDSAAGYGESSDGTNINETLVGRSL